MRKEVIQSFLFSFRLVYSCSRRLTIANMVVSMFQSILPLATVYLIKVLIDAVTEATQQPDSEKALKWVFILVGITGLAFLLNTIANSLKAYIKEVLQQKFFDDIYDKIHAQTTSLDVAYFENEEYYNLFSRALQNADSKPLSIVDNSFSFLQYSISIITLGALLITLHWSVPILLFLAALPLGLVKLRFSNTLYNYYRSKTQLDRKIWDVNDVLTNAYFAKELRLFGLERFFRKTFRSMRNTIREGYISIFKKRTVAEVFAQIFAAIAMFGALGYISFQTVKGIITVGGLAMYVIAIQRGVAFFQDLLQSVAALYEDSLYIKYIENFLGLKKKIDERTQGDDFPTTLKKGITFSNISFTYPNSKRHALKNVSMHIPAGKTVAIVGVNGAGKSTLIKLMCGLYEAQSGDILFDDTSIKSIREGALRKSISVLFQNFARYNFTAGENIWFGDTDRPPQMESIAEAARQAQIDAAISRLPEQYHTVLGKIYDHSEELSVGEWQKIGLARAFFKNSPIIVLDEPTSAMDPEAEYEIFKLFQSITQDKTSIIITHRFSSVRMADYIYVMDKEHIAEEGSHDELLAKRGRYYSMFHKQAEGYLEGIGDGE